MIENPILKDIQALKYGEEIFITIRKEIIKCSLGNSLPDNLRSTTIKVRRTGSHTVQPFESLSGWSYNIMANQIKVIYTKDEDPERWM